MKDWLIRLLLYAVNYIEDSGGSLESQSTDGNSAGEILKLRRLLLKWIASAARSPVVYFIMAKNSSEFWLEILPVWKKKLSAFYCWDDSKVTVRVIGQIYVEKINSKELGG